MNEFVGHKDYNKSMLSQLNSSFYEVSTKMWANVRKTEMKWRQNTIIFVVVTHKLIQKLYYAETKQLDIILIGKAIELSTDILKHLCYNHFCFHKNFSWYVRVNSISMTTSAMVKSLQRNFKIFLLFTMILYEVEEIFFWFDLTLYFNICIYRNESQSAWYIIASSHGCEHGTWLE